MMSIADRFTDFKTPDYFSRVDIEHILDIFIGMDNEGRQSIELRAEYEPQKITGTSCIEVNQYHKDSYNIIRFSLCDKEVTGLFYKFCEDLIEKTRHCTNKKQGYKEIINRYYLWKKLFTASKNNFLTERAIMGLIGEILFLKSGLNNRVEISDALKCWSGQDMTHKDFSLETEWYEVKAIHSGANSVKISSLEQLDSEYDGVLAVYTLEKMSASYDGITLNKLIIETAEMFELKEERDAFFKKVQMQGYEYNDYYEDIVFEIIDYNEYKVNQGFPKITKNNVAPAISKAKYEILLLDIVKFKM